MAPFLLFLCTYEPHSDSGSLCIAVDWSYDLKDTDGKFPVRYCSKNQIESFSWLIRGFRLGIQTVLPTVILA